MVPRTEFINFLRSKGYAYKDQSDKMQMWRRPADAHCVWIRRKEDPLSDEYVRSVLRQCGIADDEIMRFIGAHCCH